MIYRGQRANKPRATFPTSRYRMAAPEGAPPSTAPENSAWWKALEPVQSLGSLQSPLAGSISMAIANEPAEIRYSPFGHSCSYPDNRTGVNSHRHDTLDAELLHSPPQCHTHTPWLSAPPKILFLVRSATLLARPCLSPLSTHSPITVRPQTPAKSKLQHQFPRLARG